MSILRQEKLKGPVVSLPTFVDENHHLETDKQRKHIRWLLENGIGVDGNGVLITRDDNNDSKTERVINLSKGVCTRAEKNSYHTVYSITEMTLVAMLTKQWDHSKPPIIKVEDK